MNRRDDYMLAVLAAGDPAPHSPVQVQKLFFLLDRRIPAMVGGPHFNFEPYAYGPFDHHVYRALEALAEQGMVEIADRPGRPRCYRLTADGLRRGRTALSNMRSEVRKYITDLSTWVRTLSFPELVASIYREYPAMRAKSVFRACE